MDIELEPGSYVVAVSGGVDSMVLLRMLVAMPTLRLIVAHYDHGIRSDSNEDRLLVQRVAREYDLPFVYETGELGAEASEAVARQARYDFLHRVRQVSGTEAIITAHHQDDLLETVILNLLRGTGRRGLSSLKNVGLIRRPLLHVTKNELLRFAEREGVRWREDSTNTSERYMRNYIRHHILSRFAYADREALLRLVNQTAVLNQEIEEQLISYLHIQPAPTVLDRHSFIMLPHIVAREVMAQWLLERTSAELSRKMLERLVIAGKTGRTGTKVDIDKYYWLEISSTTLALKPRER